MNLASTKLTRSATGASGLVIASGFLALLLSGCNGFGGTSAGWITPPWSSKPDETVEGRTGGKPPYQRMAELRALAKTGPSMSREEQQRVGRPLAEQFRGEDDPLIRAQMVRTLAKFPIDEATAVLREAMSDSSIDVRIVACQAWGERSGPETVELLGRRIAEDTSVDVRLAATRALGETGEQSAVGKLAMALEDTDPALQYRAVLSLRRITGKRFDSDVNQWRQYINGETPTPPPPVSVAERVRRLF